MSQKKNLVGFRPTEEELRMLDEIKRQMGADHGGLIPLKITSSDILRAALKEFYYERFYEEKDT